MLVELEVEDENTHGDEKRQKQTSDDHEDVLRDAGPR